MNKIKLTYVCFLNKSGYSFASQNYINALDRSGKYDIKIDVIGERPSIDFLGKEKYFYYKEMIDKKDSKDRIVVYHCIPTLQKNNFYKNRKNIGFAIFETFSPPNNWILKLNKNDCIICPSVFNYKIFSHENINKPIYYIPHCLDMDLYEKTESFLKNDIFTFLFIGTWKERKGCNLLIESWLNEFSDKDNVQLVIKTDDFKKAEYFINKMKQNKGIKQGFAPIKIEYKIYEEIELLKFIKSSDCLISPSFGEGFGYSGLQCMALGVPVVITNFSGCKDYANEKTATLIEPSGFILKSTMDRIPQFTNKKWAFLSTKEIQIKMREVLNNKTGIKNKTKNAFNFVKKEFSYENIENYFTKMIREVYG